LVCLQRTELVAIDENEVAAVESDRPPSRGADDPVCADVDGLAGRVPEILDDHAALLFGGPGEDDYWGVDSKLTRRRATGAVRVLFGHGGPPLDPVPRSVEHTTSELRLRLTAASGLIRKDEFALAGRSATAVAVVGLQRGSRYRSGAELIAGSTARVRRTSASALTATMFSRDRGRLPTAGRAYRHSDENGSATAGVSAPVMTRADMNSWCSRRTCRFG
jgi:hypothetical protein